MTWQAIHRKVAAASVGIGKKVAVIPNEYKGCLGSNTAYLHAEKSKKDFQKETQ